ncbi:dihydrolipoyl dehydrogenase [Propionibacteriaceae bacterium Y2011]
MSATHDLVVLGAGSGGYAAALRAAQLGLSVALVERDKLGGTCLHRGCIPTKAILHAAEVADSVRDGAAFGVRAELQQIDAEAMLGYADRVVGGLHRGLSGLISSRGIEVVTGTGRLTTGDQVSVVVDTDDGERTLTGRHTVLATGSAPRSLPGIDIDGTRVITSDHALRLTSLPARAIVLGGGVIGAEFASAWRSLGVEVTVVEALDRLLPTEEPELSRTVHRAFTKRGIHVLTGTPAEHVDVTEQGVTLRAGGTDHTADLLLVAVGRGPVSDGLGYAEAGIELDRGCVVVDDRLTTALPSVRAVGDLVAGPQLAHRGFGHGIFVAEDVAHALDRLPEPPLPPVADHQVPRVTFCDPQVASVGLTEAQAREHHGDAVETITYDLAGVGRAQILQTRGLVKLVRRTDGPIVGVHLVGAGVSELIGEAQLITGWEAHPEDLSGFSHAHPTLDEALGEAALALAGKPLHSHG